jgi:hypothetical protein
VSSAYLASLAVAVTSLFAARFVSRGLPLPEQAVTLRPSEIVVAGVGLAVLVPSLCCDVLPGRRVSAPRLGRDQ